MSIENKHVCDLDIKNLEGTVAITGASGFVGQNLIRKLLSSDAIQIRLLSRNLKAYNARKLTDKRIEVVEGNMNNISSLTKLLRPDCTVINLAYLTNAKEFENIQATENLLNACNDIGVKRMIHLSTADVSGRLIDDYVTEDSFCYPVNEYGKTKLKIEQLILSRKKWQFDTVILRPTAIFGPGGANLEKLIGNLATGSKLINYVKSCLFARRRMNLVHVENVVSALIFMIVIKKEMDGSIYIVSDDNEAKNNFFDVEEIIINGLYGNKGYYNFPRISIPSYILSFMLIILGRGIVNPNREYSQNKLIDLGFKRTRSLDSGLIEYVNWYRSVKLTS